MATFHANLKQSFANFKAKYIKSSDAASGGTDLSMVTTGEKYTWNNKASANNAVAQTATTTNANYEVLFSSTADNTTRTEGARKNSNLKFNPSTGNLQVTKLNGATVGSDPKFTDNNTWRGIQDNVNSTSASDSLSANQGYIMSRDIPWHGTCSTAASIIEKTATTSDGKFALTTGAKVSINFTYDNTALAPTLNVDSTGAKSIKAYGTSLPSIWWQPGDVVTFTYDGTNWIMGATEGQISNIYYDLGSRSSASAVTGDDAFSKIATLNSNFADKFKMNTLIGASEQITITNVLLNRTYLITGMETSSSNAKATVRLFCSAYGNPSMITIYDENGGLYLNWAYGENNSTLTISNLHNLTVVLSVTEL